MGKKKFDSGPPQKWMKGGTWQQPKTEKKSKLAPGKPVLPIVYGKASIHDKVKELLTEPSPYDAYWADLDALFKTCGFSSHEPNDWPLVFEATEDFESFAVTGNVGPAPSGLNKATFKLLLRENPNENIVQINAIDLPEKAWSALYYFWPPEDWTFELMPDQPPEPAVISNSYSVTVTSDNGFAQYGLGAGLEFPAAIAVAKQYMEQLASGQPAHDPLHFGQKTKLIVSVFTADGSAITFKGTPEQIILHLNMVDA